MQLTSVNVTKVPKVVQSNQQQLTRDVEGEGEGEEGEGEEDTDQGQVRE